MKDLILVVLLLCGLVVPLSAGPVAAGTWYEFSFTGVGVPAKGCSPADPGGPGCVPSSGTPTVFADAPPWTFVAPAIGAYLTVTDAFLHGDAFDVLDFGALIGATPWVPQVGACGDDPVPCLADPLASHGVFALAAGPHSIGFVPHEVITPGAAYFKWDPAPEPGTYALFGLGLLALAAIRARTRKAG